MLCPGAKDAARPKEYPAPLHGVIGGIKGLYGGHIGFRV